MYVDLYGNPPNAMLGQNRADTNTRTMFGSMGNYNFTHLYYMSYDFKTGVGVNRFTPVVYRRTMPFRTK